MNSNPPTARRSVLAAAVATAVAGAVLAATAGAPASASHRERTPCKPGRQIVGHAPELYPEGVAWDPTRDAFIVGSALHGNLSTVSKNGTTQELVPSLGPVSTLGVRVDTERERILVAYSDFWVRQEEETGQPPTSGVAAFDLHTAEPIFDADISGGQDRTFGNDLTFDDEGTVYVTDSVSQVLNAVTVDGEVETVVDDPRFAAEIVGLNGIVWHEDGHLLVVRYDNGKLFRVDLDALVDDRVSEVELPEPMIGTDGIRLREDGSLYVVTNDIGEKAGVPGGTDAVTVLASDDGWASARIEERHEPWRVAGPTNIALTPYGDYVLSGDVGVLMGGGTSNQFVLRRI